MRDIVLALIGGAVGSILTFIISKYRSRLQSMECHYIEDDILSKIPQKNEDNTINQNVHCKRFSVKNTTNQDITNFKILFQFDASAHILDCFSRSKEGYNRQKVRQSRYNPNEAEAFVKNFNRGDEIKYTFNIANVTDNLYYVTESECLGFKICCKDKRKGNKSQSNHSDEILITKH